MINSKERNYQLQVTTRGPEEDHVFTISNLTEKEAKLMQRALIAADGQLREVEMRVDYGGIAQFTRTVVAG